MNCLYMIFWHLKLMGPEYPSNAKAVLWQVAYSGSWWFQYNLPFWAVILFEKTKRPLQRLLFCHKLSLGINFAALEGVFRDLAIWLTVFERWTSIKIGPVWVSQAFFGVSGPSLLRWPHFTLKAVLLAVILKHKP